MKRLSLMLIFICLLLSRNGWCTDDYRLNVSGVAARQYQRAVNAETGRSVLLPDVERTAALRRPHQFRTFVYHGRKDETVTVKVKSVQFAPEVFLRDGSDKSLAEEMNREGKREVEIEQTLPSDGDYYIRVRAKGAGQGLYQVVVRSKMPDPEAPAQANGAASGQTGLPSR
jgi:hypothetical protein